MPLKDRDSIFYVRKLIEKNKKSESPFLDLGNCNIVSLSTFPELKELKHLKYLNFGPFYYSWIKSKNPFSANDIGDKGAKLIAEELVNLNLLDLSGNNIGVEGARLIAHKLVNLSSLNLADNNIGDEGAYSISYMLDNLSSLNLAINNIGDEGAYSIADKLVKLSSLDLSGNNIGDEGASAIADKLVNLSSLNLSSNKIGVKGASAIAHKLVNLSFLNLAINKIGDEGASAIADKLVNLAFLNLAYNNIGVKGASAIAHKLVNLSSLDLRVNKIGDEGASAIAHKLVNLSSLDLSGNKIGDEGASAIAHKLVNLSFLDLRVNNIGDLGASAIAHKLVNLSSLNLSSNKIGDEGASAIAHKLVNLSSLDLRVNNIGDLGASAIAHKLVNLSSFDITHNNIKNIPPEILKNIKALRNYENSAKIQSHKVKMILLGNTRAGKSALAYLLQNNKLNLDPVSTHGMEHWSWKESLNNNDKLNINIYDFGGQDYYHATHHIFFSYSTLYVVLWHNELFESTEPLEEGQHFDLGYWLGNIQYLLNGKQDDSSEDNQTPIWLVQNKSDLVKENPRIIPKSHLVEAYKVDPNGMFYLSVENFNKQKQGFKDEWIYFRTHLVNKLTQLAGNFRITKIWAAVRDEVIPKLQTQNLLIVETSKFYNLCDDILAEKKGKKEDYNAALTYLNNCGEVVQFKDIPSLTDKIILSPKKMMSVLYSILSLQAKINHGEININTNQDILENEKIDKTTYDLFVDILIHYELIFQHPIKLDTFIAPQYLSASPYQDILNDLLPISLIIHYEDFMPMSIMGNFITKYLRDDSTAKYWKYGAIFSSGSCYCMVRMDRAKKKIFIHVEPNKDKSGTQNNFVKAREEKYLLLYSYFEFFTTLPKFNKNNLSINDNINEYVESTFDTTKTMSESIYYKENKNVAFSSKLSNPKFITGLELSIDDSNFFYLNSVIKDLEHCNGRLPTIEGEYKQVPALFYYLLNKKQNTPKRVFFCYSHKDVLYKEELESHLAALKKRGMVESWFDTKIVPGDEWDDTIKQQISKSDIVILLLSADFMNSSYIWKTEIPIARSEGKKIIPIFLRPCDYEGLEIEVAQGIPFFDDIDTPSKSKEAWIVSEAFKYRDQAYLKVVDHLKTVINQK
jgi:GTPase SAR1 family protein